MSTLLTIDERKIKESIEAVAKPGYVVKVSHIARTEMPRPPTPSLTICGTQTIASQSNTLSRDHITILRQKIEKSGMQLKTAEELDTEIAEAKRRK